MALENASWVLDKAQSAIRSGTEVLKSAAQQAVTTLSRQTSKEPEIPSPPSQGTSSSSPVEERAKRCNLRSLLNCYAGLRRRKAEEGDPVFELLFDQEGSR
jgi:hypothetical protein